MSTFNRRLLYRFRKWPFKACLAFALIGLVTDTLANNAPTGQGIWYYEIGGAQVVPHPPNPNVTSLDLSASLQLSAGYSCGKFDPVLSVANTLNQVKTGAEDMLKAMTDAATGAIAALPALILQRANPGLYDLLQNALVAANYKVDLATKSCQQMEAEIAQGKNPYHELLVLSKGNDWKRAMSIGQADINQASTQIENSNGDNGLPWVFGQQAGGRNQPAINLTADVVKAGYNISLSKPPSASLGLGSLDTTQLTQLWPTQLDSVKWVTNVVGEHIVTTCDGCPKISQPGQGLLPELTYEQENIKLELTQLLQNTDPPTRVQLSQLSGTNIQITREVMDALRDLTDGEQEIYIARLANEIALSRTLEKSLYARRLLLVGKQIPEVTTNKPATEHIETAIETLDSSTDRLLVEYRTRQLLSANTITQVLERSYQRRNQSRSIPTQGPLDKRPLIEGRVQD